MGFFKKLLGTAAVAGAAVGGALYVKKRKDERENGAEFEDFDDLKIFDVNKDSDAEGNPKVTITFNSHKAKKVANAAADKVIDVTDKAKDTVTEKLGEDTVNSMKEKFDDAKDKLSDVADSAKVFAKDAKDLVVDTVGEENIQAVKDKVSDVVDTAKEKVSDAMDKVKKTSESNDVFDEDDFVDEDLEPIVSTADTMHADDIETEDDVVTEEDSEDDEFLKDELEDL